MNKNERPQTAYALQLVGPDELRLNCEKPVVEPTGFQVLVKIEATGLCFSDLKLLKQFGAHPRKRAVISGMEPAEIDAIPSYVPGDEPTVPGHESVGRIIAVGDQVREHRVGERCLIQTDYRGLSTGSGGNASFGYNFEGALQEYVIIDERVSRDHITGERFLLPADEDQSASAVCLVEPWACVENSYATAERQTILAASRLLVVVDSGRAARGLAESFSADGPPASITAISAEPTQREALEKLGVPLQDATDIASLPDQAFDDIVYFGADAATIEALSSKLDAGCIVNIVTGGAHIDRPAAIGIGRLHYGGTRWVGARSDSAADGYAMIPATGEVRDGERCLVVGAGGPMGQMHVVRDICSDASGLSVVATDFDDARLESLLGVAAPLAKKRGVDLRAVNPSKTPLEETFTYTAIMAPLAPLVSQAIALSAPDAMVNIFAGIPAPTVSEIDLDAIIEKRCFVFGTSGSLLCDMKSMLNKLQAGQLDTNCSVDAVCGMAGAADGISAVENRTVAGKIIVYPMLHEMGLITLDELSEKYPTVAAKLDNGLWNREAELELLQIAQ